MPGSPFDVTQLYVYAKSLNAQAARLPRGVQMSVTDVVADMVAGMKELSPVDTGFNRDSITSDVVYTPSGATGTAGPESHYGGYLQLGTSKMAPRDYMFSPARAAEAELEAKLAALL